MATAAPRQLPRARSPGASADAAVPASADPSRPAAHASTNARAAATPSRAACGSLCRQPARVAAAAACSARNADGAASTPRLLWTRATTAPSHTAGVPAVSPAGTSLVWLSPVFLVGSSCKSASRHAAADSTSGIVPTTAASASQQQSAALVYYAACVDAQFQMTCACQRP
eukprot:364927-Chlamydomonas_euryale.AAC.12